MSSFKKDEIKELVDSVVVPVKFKIFDDNEFDLLVISEKDFLSHNILMARFALSLVKKIGAEPVDVFENILDIYNKYDISKPSMKKVFFYFFELFYLWVASFNEKAMDTFDKDIRDFESLIENETGINLEITDENGIFIFKSDIENDKIDREHFVSAKKVSAQEFMEDSFLDEDLIADMEESLGKLNSIADFNQEITEEFIKSVVAILDEFIKVFSYGYEFGVLATSLTEFGQKLLSLDLDSLPTDQRILYKEFVLNIASDLQDWADNVIFKQDAVDIHYLDASINANIAQFDVLLEDIS